MSNWRECCRKKCYFSLSAFSRISHCLNVFAVLCRAWLEEMVHLALQEMMDAQRVVKALSILHFLNFLNF